jgi:hypothetical protein
MVREWDYQHHPDLAQGLEAVWRKREQIYDCERTASRLPLEYRTMADVELKETKLRHLREKLAAAEAALQQAAERCPGQS